VKKTSRKIFINQDSGYLMIDIINAHALAGFNCILITGRLIERNTSLHSTVKVDRIIKYNRTTTFWRILTWGIGFLQIVQKVLFKYRRDKLFIVSNPPFAPLLTRLVKNPFELLIFDIYPDALSELGYLSSNSFLIKWWKKSNEKVFNRATTIYTITDSMRQILRSYAGNKEVEIVPVWTDNNFFKPVDPAVNPFLKKHKLSGKFIVMYSGNIGLSGDVDVLLDIATEIRRDDIVFLIIGDGAKKEKIRDKARQLDLKNVMFLPWQPVAELPFSLSSASIAVISLGIKASKLAIPSKLYNFLSVGAPLLCITAKGSEVDKLVIKYKCGGSFEPNDIKGIVDYIVELTENNELLQLMKANSLKASGNFNVSNVNKFLTASYSA
jgi:glycosyltransferase involved in cell wall biosynthesis